MKKRPPLNPCTKSRARQLRQDATFPERLLWGKLRSRRLAGLKFRRQHSIGDYFADFYCEAHRLVLELDGASHDGRADDDLRRTRYLESCGLRVMRFTNDDVLQEMDAILTAILLACGVDPDSPPRAK